MNPDIISLNEVEYYTGWGYEDQPARLASLLKSKTGRTWYYKFATASGASRGDGNLILSRYPFVVADSQLLSYTRVVVQVAVNVNGRNVSFFSTLKRDSDAARQLDSGIDPKTIPNYLLDVDNHLVIPAGQKVRFLLTAQDVIHAWWVPAFGMKKDAIPGYVNEIWVQVDADKIGTYRGQCAELCGRDHGFMPIVVEVKSPAEFDAWLRAKQAEQKLAAVAPDAPAVTASAAPAAVAQ